MVEVVGNKITMNKKGILGLSTGQVIVIVVFLLAFSLTLYVIFGLTEKWHDILCAGLEVIAPDWGILDWANPKGWVGC